VCSDSTREVVMGFTVTRPAGAKDAEFQEYMRLLLQQDVDLTNAPRMLEPNTGRRWVHVWDSEEGAKTFAKELKKRTDKAWYVEKVQEPSRGPLGPIMVQLRRQATGLVFGLHPLSQALVESLYPDAFGSTTVFIDAQRWQDFQKSGRPLSDLARDMAII